MSGGNFYSEHLYQRYSKDTEELEKNAREYPFSSLAGFLLLYHYKKTSHAEFENFAKKTALHFSNPHWLQFILYQKPGEIKAELLRENKIHNEAGKPVELNNEATVEVAVTQNFVEQTETEKPNEEIKDGDLITEVKHEEYKIKTEPVSETLNEQNTQPEDKKSGTPEETQVPFFFQATTSIENEIPDNTEEIIAFDPLHTVDYFASQGIKLNDEELITNDKLGTQMKSFTAWLKCMKKLHTTKLTEQSIVSENLIQTSAEQSNINTEILTEAMAEVLIKQDKKEKAIDMFNKLSLINPAKSAYFAAKIESIKLR